MARNRTLLELLDSLRVQTGASQNPAHNLQLRDAQVAKLQYWQNFLWDDYNWPHLRVRRQIPASIGERYYSPPSDIPLERLESIEVFRDGLWVPLRAGISGYHRSVWNSDLDQRSWPPQAWQLYEDGNVEIWPIPDTAANSVTQDGVLQFTGIRALHKFVDDGDKADLDDLLIVFFAAAEMLDAKGDKGARSKQAQAERRYARLKSDLTPRRRFQMFGTAQPYPTGHRSFVPTYRPPGT